MFSEKRNNPGVKSNMPSAISRKATFRKGLGNALAGVWLAVLLPIVAVFSLTMLFLSLPERPVPNFLVAGSWVSGHEDYNSGVPDFRVPDSLLSGVSNSWLQGFPAAAEELPSPSDWIREEQITVLPDRVILEVEGATWVSFTDTNSMDPFIDESAHALELKPSSSQEIRPGDVISYRTPQGIFIHRVIAAGLDEEGEYYIVKGDNNATADPFKVHFGDIEGVLVAVIY